MSGDTNMIDDNVISKNKLQELNDLYMLIKKERIKYVMNDIFLDTIIETCRPSYGLSEVLGVKIKDIILRGELMNCIQVKKNDMSQPEALLDNFNNIELSFENQKDLKVALERRIKEKGDLFLKELNELSDSDAKSLDEIIDHIKFDSDLEQNNLLSLQRDLIEKQKLYIKSLVNYGQKLQELIELKTKTGVTRSEERAVLNELVTKKINLRHKLLSTKVRLTIFEELPLSMDAYRKALNDLKNQQQDCCREIEKIKSDMANYQIVSNNEEYQEILKEYKQYKRRVDDKIWISSKLKKGSTKNS